MIGYHPLMTPEEIAAFTVRFNHLHDGYIVSALLNGPIDAHGFRPPEEPPVLKVSVLVTSLAEKPVVELLFNDVRDFRLPPWGYIFDFQITPQSDVQGDAEYRWTDRYYVFSTEPCFRWRRHEIENLGNTHYAVAGKIYWRLVKENT